MLDSSFCEPEAKKPEGDLEGVKNRVLLLARELNVKKPWDFLGRRNLYLRGLQLLQNEIADLKSSRQESELEEMFCEIDILLEEIEDFLNSDLFVSETADLITRLNELSLAAKKIEIKIFTLFKNKKPADKFSSKADSLRAELEGLFGNVQRRLMIVYGDEAAGLMEKCDAADRDVVRVCSLLGFN